MMKLLAKLGRFFAHIAATDDDDETLRKLQEESAMVDEVLNDWKVFEAHPPNTLGHREVYEFTAALNGLPPGEFPTAFAQYLSTLDKTTSLIADLHQNKSVQYEMLFVLPIGKAGLNLEDGTAPSAGSVLGMVSALGDAIKEQLAKELDRADIRTLKPDNLLECLKNRFRVQVYLLTIPGKLRPDRFVYLTKRRVGGAGTVNFLIRVAEGVRPDEQILMNEINNVVLRNSGQPFSWGPVRSAVYYDSYEFFLCAYPRSKVAIFLSDFVGQQAVHQRTLRTRVVHVAGYPALCRTIEDVAQDIRKFAGNKLVVLCARNDVGPLYLQGVSTSFSHEKGNIALIGPAAREAGTDDWTLPALPHPSEECCDVLLADAINWFPDISQQPPAFANVRNPQIMVNVQSGCREQNHSLLETLCPEGAEGLFSILLDERQKYRLLRQKGIHPDTVFRLASRQAVRPDLRAGATDFMRRLLTEDQWKVQPQTQESAEGQVLLGDGIFYLAVGLEALGYFFFELRTASKLVRSSARPIAFQSDFGQTRLFELCERKGISGLKHANRAGSEGNLFRGQDAHGEWRYVKVFYGEQLDDHHEALRQVWGPLERFRLLPPGIERLRLDQDYRELPPSDRSKAATWVILSPEFRTLEVALESESAVEDRVQWVEALREFYQRALGAGLCFLDCSADDVIMLDGGCRMTLIDYGSYLPAASYQATAEPGKEEYRDPALQRWLRTNDPVPRARELLRAQHAYNLGLLEYRIWTGAICPLPGAWEALCAATEDGFRTHYRALLAETERKLQQSFRELEVQPEMAADLVQAAMLGFNASVLERQPPGDLAAS